MSKRNPGWLNGSKSSFGRRRQAKRTSTLMEALEKRRLLAGAQPYVFTATGLGGGGTDYNAVINPTNKNELYCETDMGEVWHTTNDGFTWTTINNVGPSGLTSQYVATVQFTSNSNIQYVADGSPCITTNDGQSWSVMPGWAAVTATNGGGLDKFLYASPNNSSDLIVEWEKGTGPYSLEYYFSSNSGQTFTPITGSSSSDDPYVPWGAGAFWDSNNANNIYFADNYKLYWTNNGGASWTGSAAPLTPAGSPTGSGNAASYYSITGSSTVSGSTVLWAVTLNSADFAGNGGYGSTNFASAFGGLYTTPSFSGPFAGNSSLSLMSGTSSSTWIDQTVGASNKAELYPKFVQMLPDNINDVWIGGGDNYCHTSGYSTSAPIVYEGVNPTPSNPNIATETWNPLLQSSRDSTIMDSPGAVTSISITAAGSGYSTSPTGFAVSITGGGGSGAEAWAYAPNGSITSVIIQNVGTGYTSQPTISFANGGGSAATATDTVTTPGSAMLPNQNTYTHFEGDGSQTIYGAASTVSFILSPLSGSSGNPVMIYTTQGSFFESIDNGANWYDIQVGGPTTPNQGTTTGSFVMPTTGDPDPFLLNTNELEWTPEGLDTSSSTYWPAATDNETAVWNQTFLSPQTIFADITDTTYSQSTNNGASWNFPLFDPTNQGISQNIPNTMYQTAYDPSDGILYGITSDRHNLYTNGFTDDGDVEHLGKNKVVYSADQGETWHTVYIFPFGSAPRTIAIDPNNPNIVFAGTANHLSYPSIGSNNSSIGLLVGGGIWMTKNATQGTNATWTYLGDGYGAVATAVMDITGYTNLVGGTGYTANFPVTFSGGGGTGAAATAYATSGVITSISITNFGSGYTADPTVSFTNGGGAGAKATATMSVSGFSGTNGGSSYGLQGGTNLVEGVVFTSSELDSTGVGATATTTLSGNSLTAPVLTHGGSGYTAVPTVTLYSQSLDAQPSRMLDPSGTTTGSIQTFSGDHPYQIDVLNNGGGSTNTINVVVVMAPRTEASGVPYDNAGVWYGHSTDGGNVWTWTDKSDPSVSNFTFKGTSVPNEIPYWTSSLTIDPNNDPNESTWYLTENDVLSVTNTPGYIYKTTDSGADWSVYSTIGEGNSLWIQPGGTTMLYAAKNLGIQYVPNYNAANPQFYTEQNFPFNYVNMLVSNPFNSNQVWADTFGAGSWMMDMSTPGLAAVVQNLSVVPMGSISSADAEALLSWTVQAPLPTSYIVEAATNSSFSTGTMTATVPNYEDSSFLFTGLSSGTEYYFRVEAVNSSGDSAWSSTVSTRMDETPLGASTIYEGFSYSNTAGSNYLNGQNGGTGWASSWSTGGATNSADIIVSPSSWTPSNGYVPPLSTGNAAQISSSGVAATRTLSSSVGSSGTVLWASFELNEKGGEDIYFGSPTNGFGIGSNANGDLQFYTVSGTNTISYPATINGSESALASGDGSLIAARIDFESSGTSVDLYVNPLPGQMYPTNLEGWWGSDVWPSGVNGFIPTGTATGDFNFTPSKVVSLTVPANSGGGYDEIRLGNTYTDVTPPVSTLSAPAAPGVLTATAMSGNEIDLAWSNSATNQAGVFVEQSTNGSNWTAIEKVYDPNALVSSYIVSDLNPATKYYFRVGSYNGGTASASTTADYDASANATTTSNAPSAVSNLSVAANSSQFDLSWSASSGATGYNLQYVAYGGANAPDANTAFNDGEVAWTNVPLGNTTADTLSGLATNTTYYFRIYANNSSGGNSFCSNIVSGTILPGSAPNVPSLTSVTANSSSSISLTWSDSTSGVTYNIERSTNDSSGWTTIATGISNTTWTDNASNDPGNPLSANTTYYYQVDATDSGGTSGWSGTTNNSALTYPAAPTGLSAVPGTNSIVLTWAANTNEASFTIQRSTDDTNWNTSYTGISKNSATWTDASPASGTSYYYRIDAVNATGDSGYDVIAGGTNSGVATVIAYEGFNYATSGTWNGAGTTGIGFAGNWNISNSNDASIVTPGLSYTNGTSTLTVSGNALKLIGTSANETATETLNQTVGGTSGSTLWVSYEINGTGAGEQLVIGTASGTSGVGVEFWWTSNLLDMRLNTISSSTLVNGYASTTANTTYLVVGEIQYNATSPVVTEWIDPAPDSANNAAPTNALFSVTKTLPSTSGAFSPTTELTLLDGNASYNCTFDEVRLGTTYNSVAPDPIVNSGPSVTTHKKKMPRGNRPSPFLASVVSNRSADVISKPATAAANRFYPGLDGGAWQWTNAANDADNVLLGTTSKKGLFN